MGTLIDYDNFRAIVFKSRWLNRSSTQGCKSISQIHAKTIRDSTSQRLAVAKVIMVQSDKPPMRHSDPSCHSVAPRLDRRDHQASDLCCMH